MILTEQQVRQYLYNAGFRGPHLNFAIAIAACESSFDTDAHNTYGEDSRGLMQINVDAHPEYSYLDLFDPQINTQAAYQIYTQAGNDFSDWSCESIVLDKNKELFFGIALAFIGIILLYSS